MNEAALTSESYKNQSAPEERVHIGVAEMVIVLTILAGFDLMQFIFNITGLGIIVAIGLVPMATGFLFLWRHLRHFNIPAGGSIFKRMAANHFALIGTTTIIGMMPIINSLPEYLACGVITIVAVNYL